MAIYYKSERVGSRGDTSVTAEERAYIIRTLDRRTGLWFAHDFSRMAALAAGNLRAREAVPKLIKLLSLRQKNYEMVGAEAASALGKIGDPQALPHLFAALADNRNVVRLYAAKAIQRIAKRNQGAIESFRTPKRFSQAVNILSALQLPTEAQGNRAKSLIGSSNHAWFLVLDVNAMYGIVLLMTPNPMGPRNEIRIREAAARLRKAYSPASYFSNLKLPYLARLTERFGTNSDMD